MVKGLSIVYINVVEDFFGEISTRVKNIRDIAVDFMNHG